MPVEGVINLYKPTGASSAQYAYRLRPILGERRVGHAGALDPFAAGVLVVCVGRATRLVERLMGLTKEYETTVRLDVTSATLDPESEFEPVQGCADPGEAAVRQAAAAMVGVVQQTPPAFSAIKIGGRPSYERARRELRHGRPGADAGRMSEAGASDDPAIESSTPRPRAVRIDSIEVVRYAWPRVELRIRCGRGTYIRSIARDVGRALGVGGCCETLRRTAVGPLRIGESIDLQVASPEAVRGALRPAAEVVAMLSAWADDRGA